jgi:hypothetical protein
VSLGCYIRFDDHSKNIVRKNPPKGKVKVIPDVEESEDTSNG